MANPMPSRICKGDKARFKDPLAAKKYAPYGFRAADILDVKNVTKIGGSPMLHVPHPQYPGETTCVWARDCKLGWPKSCQERKEALGVI